MLNNYLEFEIKWRLQELLREQGFVAVMKSESGRRLLANLAALEKARGRVKAAA
jgi:ribosomal protein L34